MKLEQKILAVVWTTTAIALIILVPMKKFKHAQVIFLFKQILTWLFGALVVEKGLIKYPYREFVKAINTSFTFEFFVYPAICVLFNLYYPHKKPKSYQLIYYAWITTAITIFEVVIEKYTELIKYIKWNWYFTWSTLFITFFLSRKFYEWFFNLNERSIGANK